MILSSRTKLIWHKTTNLNLQLFFLKKTLINDRLIVWNVYWNFTFQLFINFQFYTRETCYFFNFLTLLLFFLFVHKLCNLKNLKTRKAMSSKRSGVFFHVKLIIYLLVLYNLHESSFKSGSLFTSKQK